MIGNVANDKELASFTKSKSPLALQLFQHFVDEYNKVGKVVLHPTKTTIGIANKDKRIAWVTQPGKNFIHIVFPFKKAYPDNLCFQKMSPVLGDAKQFNHHFRMYYKEDINEEVFEFMKLAYKGA